MSKTITNNQTNKPTTYYIDATNVCYWRNPDIPSLSVLLKLLLVLKKEKKQAFFCIFDANTAHKLPPDERDIYNFMLNNGNFHQVSGGKRADDYILSLADMYNGFVISNDNYSDPKYSRYRWKDRDSRPTRLFMGEVIKTIDGEHLMLFDLDINVRLDQSVSELFKELEKVLNPPKENYKGVIKFYNNQRGWGGITFLKETDIAFTKPPESNLNFEEGQEVEFKIVETDKGQLAEEITILPTILKFVKGTIVSYDELRESGFIAIDEGPQRLFFRKSYFAEGVDNSQLTKNQQIECVIGANSKGDCARQIRFPEPDSKDLVKEYEEKAKVADEKLKSLQDLLLSANKKLIEQAQELRMFRKNIEKETESLKKTHREEIDVLKTKFKAELQGLLPNPSDNSNTKSEPNLKQAKKKAHLKNIEEVKEAPKENIKPESEIVQTPQVVTKNVDEKKKGSKNKKSHKGSDQHHQVSIKPKVEEAPIILPPTVSESTEKIDLSSAKKKLIKNQISPVPEILPVQIEEIKIKEIAPLSKKDNEQEKVPVKEVAMAKSELNKQTLKDVSKPIKQKNPVQKKEPVVPMLDDFDTEDKRVNWWSKLEPQWKKAFNVLLGNQESMNKPIDKDMTRIIYLTKIDLDNTEKQTLSFKLTNLSGIKHLTNINYLNVSGHNLENINGITKLVELEYLDCSHNKINTLNGLTYLEKLQVLICSHNQLRAGNLKGMNYKLPLLKKLDCRSNLFVPADTKFLTDLEIKGMQF
jgi:cold shock CspA family protein